MLEEADLGHRVVVRRKVTLAGRTAYRDLLGQLVAINADHIVVRTDQDERRTIPLPEIHLAKRVPPRPPRHSEIIELERLAERAWPAPVREQLGEWILRAADGFTSRANSALVLGDPGMALTDAIMACRSWYRALGLVPRISVPLPVRRDVAAAATALGWQAQPVVLVQSADLTTATQADPARSPAGPELRVRARPSQAYLDLIASRRGELPPAALQVMCAPAEVGFAELYVEGRLVAGARGAMVERWVHLGLLEVVAGDRRRGLGTLVSQAVLAWGRRLGATRAMLQVERSNTAALALYHQLGFAAHHEYVTYSAELARDAEPARDVEPARDAEPAQPPQDLVDHDAQRP